MHLHRECSERVLEDSMGVNEVEWATHSGLRRLRRLESLRRRSRSGNATGISSGKTSGKRWAGVAESATAIVQRQRFCINTVPTNTTRRIRAAYQVLLVGPRSTPAGA